MLESTPARVSLIKLGHKWTQILFIILNYTIGIWLCSQPRIYLNSQSKFYDVLTLEHTTTFPTQSTQKNMKHLLHLVSPGYETFTQL